MVPTQEGFIIINQKLTNCAGPISRILKIVDGPSPGGARPGPLIFAYFNFRRPTFKLFRLPECPRQGPARTLDEKSKELRLRPQTDGKKHYTGHSCAPTRNILRAGSHHTCAPSRNTLVR